MVDVFQYTDYRQYLKDWYSGYVQRHPHFTQRQWSERLGIDQGFLVRILQGTALLSLNRVDDFVRVLKLEHREEEYFRQMVRFCRAKGEEEIQREFADLIALKDVRTRSLDQNQYQFYQYWWYATVRAILSVKEFHGDYAQLASDCLPPITESQAREAVALLESLGLVYRNAAGVWELTEQHITTGDSWRSAAIRQYQKENIRLAQDALVNLEPHTRDISSMTLTIKFSELEMVRARIAEFRKELVQMIQENSDMDSVYQLNIQFFPVMQTPSEKGEVAE